MTLRVRNYYGLVTLHNCDAGVGCSQVDTNNLCHNLLSFYLFVLIFRFVWSVLAHPLVLESLCRGRRFFVEQRLYQRYFMPFFTVFRHFFAYQTDTSREKYDIVSV